ncbi:MAG: deoxyribodipyrimidine photo-lyase [Pseudomonadota bacterium]
MSSLHLIWFREDLRLHDHAALRAACHAAARDQGQVAPIFIAPLGEALITGAPAAGCERLWQSLTDLRAALAERGGILHLRQGAPEAVFSELHRAYGLAAIHAHETITAGASDRAMTAWSMRAGVPYRLYPQYGRSEWPVDTPEGRAAWQAFMARPRQALVELPMGANMGEGRWPVLADQNLAPGSCRSQAIAMLRAFLSIKPSSADAVQRQAADARRGLDPFLKLGVVSVREVWQAAMSARDQYARTEMDSRVAAIDAFVRLLPDLGAVLRRHRDLDRTRHTRKARPRAARTGTQMSLDLALPKSDGARRGA